MKIVALKETAKRENRVAITPDTAKLFIAAGHHVFVEQRAGEQSGFSDEEYTNVGVKIIKDLAHLIQDADILLKVQAGNGDEIPYLQKNCVIVGLLTPYNNQKYLKAIADKQVKILAMELMPRITKAQNMDVLSSQSNLAGYRAVIEAAYHFNRGLSMMMTAAGTLAPAKILILGIGVAGLAAIATAKRLGAVVFGSDIRKNTKEQVESLGGKFLAPEDFSDMEDNTGYAKMITDEEMKEYNDFLANKVKDFDIIITTAQIPNKPAPILLTRNMVKSLKPGSIIVDMSVNNGGNVEGSERDEIVVKNGVKIIGYSNLASHIAYDASKLYARNLYNVIQYTIQNDSFTFEDEIVKQLLVQ